MLRVLQSCAFRRQHAYFFSQSTSSRKEEKCPFDDVLKYKEPELFKRYGLRQDHEQSALLKALKSANVVNISPKGDESETSKESRIQAMTLSGIDLDPYSPLPSTLYIRDFYSRLFKSMWAKRNTILIGNPGISKSWFQWYMIYRLANEKVPNPPKVIVHQTGASLLTFLFLQDNKA